MRAGRVKVSTPSPPYRSATTTHPRPRYNQQFGGSWLFWPTRGTWGADWKEDLADIPEDIRNLHVKYKIDPGYIGPGPVALNYATHKDASPAEHVVASVVRWSSGSFRGREGMCVVSYSALWFVVGGESDYSTAQLPRSQQIDEMSRGTTEFSGSSNEQGLLIGATSQLTNDWLWR
jgi:hypothetical protein